MSKYNKTQGLMKSPKVVLFSFLVFCISFHANAQQITNVQASLQGDNIVVTYNLLSPDPNARFDIKLFSSHNNFSSPVNLVSGDVGSGVSPGTGKRIVWNARQELTSFSGNLTFEVRGNPVAPSQPQQETTDPNQLRFTNPTEGDNFKMGSMMNIRWSGGLPQDVKLELHRNNIMIQPLTSTQNTGSYNWNIPKDKSLKGGNYSIKLFNINQPNGAVFSGAFRIKGKIPVLVYVLPAVAVGGVLGAILLSGGDDGGTEPTTDVNLPTPPRPDGGN